MPDRINGKQIEKIIESFDNTQYIKNAAYFQGSNPTILNKNFDGTPDNRVPLPFGRRTVLDIAGYAYKPGYVTYIFDDIENNEAQVEQIKEIFIDNKEELVSGEVFQDALIKGEGAELMYWEGGNTFPQFVQIPREQCIFVNNDTVKADLQYSIRFYTSKIIDVNGDVQEINHADIYYPDVIQFFENTGRKTQNTVNPQESNQTNTTENESGYTLVREEQHFFGDIPLYPFEINSDKMGVFQCAIKLIDAMDDMTSDSILNALERFNDHYLVLSKKLDQLDVDNIKARNIFDGMGSRDEGNFVEFLNRQMDINSSIEGFKVYERLYYELTGIPNLSDEKFNSQSGIAILYALIPFENLVSTFQVYFENGLQYRLKLLNNLLKLDVKANIDWKRNLPVNTLEKINEVVTLVREGLLSKETAIAKIPGNYIEDPEAELEKLKTEKEENMKAFNDQFTEPMDNTDKPPNVEDEEQGQKPPAGDEE